MRIAGFVTDRESNSPIEDAEVRITREVGGDLIASLPSNREGTFRWEDELNRHIGQPLVFTVEHERYFPYQAAHIGEQEIAVTLPMTPREQQPGPDPPPGFLDRFLAWFLGLLPWQRLLLIGGPVLIVIVALLVVWWASRPVDGPQPPPFSCDKPSIQQAATVAGPASLWRIAELCARSNNLPLQFNAVEACAQQGYGLCLMTMGGWYDPTQASEPTPFTQRNAALAAQYYRRARTEGVDDARARLDGLCRALRGQGGQAAADASC